MPMKPLSKITPSLHQANALYENRYPSQLPLARPLMQTLLQRQSGTVPDAVAHGCTGRVMIKSASDVAIALNPNLKC